MNIDKVKNQLGTNLFDYIGGLDKIQLQNMRRELIDDMDQFSETFDHNLSENRRMEIWLINYRLG